MSTNTRETSADILRNRTPVRGRNKQMLPVEFENAHVVRTAEASRTPDHDLQHWAEFARRCADYLQNLRCRRLLFPRIVQLATKPRDLSFLTSTGGTAMARTLNGLRLAASRFSQFAAYFGAPSHRPPKAQDKALCNLKIAHWKVDGCEFRHRSLSVRPMSALGQKRKSR